MHICIVTVAAITDKKNWGGIHTHTEFLATIFQKLGHEATILTHPHPEGINDEVRNGFHIYYINKRSAINTLEGLNKKKPISLILSEGNSIVSIFGIKSFRDVPLLYILHIPGYMHYFNSWQQVQSFRTFLSFLRNIMDITIRIISQEIPLTHISHKVISVSSLKARQLRWIYMTRKNKIITLNNWVDINHFAPNAQKRIIARKKWGIKNDTLTFLCVGGLWRPKGFHIAIKAFAKTAQSLQNTVLVISGSGRDYFIKYLKYMANIEGVGNRIIFLGNTPHSELPSVYNMADIFLMPSLMSEGHAYTLIEAMACGLPLIATNRGGNIETIDNAGVLVKPGCPESLSNAMLELARNTQKMEFYSNNARKKATDLFSENAAIKNVSELLKKITLKAL